MEINTSQKQPTSFVDLPLDCWLHIFNDLSLRDVFRLSETCKTIHTVMSDHKQPKVFALWNAISIRTLGRPLTSYGEFKKEETNSKQFLVKKHQILNVYLSSQMTHSYTTRYPQFAIDAEALSVFKSSSVPFLHFYDRMEIEFLRKLWIEIPAKEQEPIMKDILKRLDFSRTSFSESFRLWMALIRLPGQSNVIDRFFQHFSNYFVDTNLEYKGAINADTLSLFAFSSMMLNVDKTSPNVKNKMDWQQFLRNTSGMFTKLTPELSNKLLKEVWQDAAIDYLVYIPFTVEVDARVTMRKGILQTLLGSSSSSFSSSSSNSPIADDQLDIYNVSTVRLKLEPDGRMIVTSLPTRKKLSEPIVYLDTNIRKSVENLEVNDFDLKFRVKSIDKKFSFQVSSVNVTRVFKTAYLWKDQLPLLEKCRSIVEKWKLI